MWLVDSVEWYLAHVASFISKQIEIHGSLLISKISRELFFCLKDVNLMTLRENLRDFFIFAFHYNFWLKVNRGR